MTWAVYRTSYDRTNVNCIITRNARWYYLRLPLAVGYVKTADSNIIIRPHFPIKPRGSRSILELWEINKRKNKPVFYYILYDDATVKSWTGHCAWTWKRFGAEPWRPDRLRHIRYSVTQLPQRRPCLRGG